LHAPGFLGSLTQISPAAGTSMSMPDLPFADAAEGASVMVAAHLRMNLEARPPDGGPELRSRSAVATRPRLIVPRRNGVAYALMETDSTGLSRFVLPLARDDDAETAFPLEIPREGVTHRTLRVFMWAAQPLLGPGPLAVAARWERLRRPNELVQWGGDGVWRTVHADACAGGPCLLLLHDTFGTPESSFSEWLGHESFRGILARYEGRCLAFAHPTLAAGVADNVAWLTGILPRRIQALDIVAHGRGGLVARALAADREVPVRRGVLVGAPNYGTPLAKAANLGALLDANAAPLARMERARAKPILEGLLGVARFLVSGPLPRLPGIEAQEPGGDTLLALNALEPSQRWYSIGSNFEGVARPRADSPFGDLPNDLVTPSDGCHLPTATPEDSLRIAGAQIHHHNYFSSPAVRDRLATWLL
jgi:pimeloyl-ACP methyl ester carboxylesterase